MGVLAALYQGQTGVVCEDRDSRKFEIGRDTKQGGPVSPKIFNAVLEVVFRRLKERWEKRKWGLRMHATWPTRWLTNLRFADDVMLTATTLPQLEKMVGDLAEEARKAGLELHFGKTKILSNMQVRRGVSAAQHADVLGQPVEVLPFDGSVAYLGREVSFADHHDVELQNRLSKAWAKFMVHKEELCSRHYLLHDRLRLFGAVISPSVLYGCGAWAMTTERERKLRTTQRKMLRKMLGAHRGRKVGKRVTREGAKSGEARDDDDQHSTQSGSSSTTSSATKEKSTGSDDEEEAEEEEEEESWVDWITRATHLAADAARKAGVVDWVEEQRRRKWRWAGHVARREDGRWSRSILDWEPVGGRRSWGRPVLRWEDPLSKFAKSKDVNWHRAAQDRGQWGIWEDEFVAKRW